MTGDDWPEGADETSIGPDMPPDLEGLPPRPEAGCAWWLAICLVGPVCVVGGRCVAGSGTDPSFTLFTLVMVVALPGLGLFWLWKVFSLDRRYGPCPECGEPTWFLGPCPGCGTRWPGAPRLVNPLVPVLGVAAALILGLMVLGGACEALKRGKDTLPLPGRPSGTDPAPGGCGGANRSGRDG